MNAVIFFFTSIVVSQLVKTTRGQTLALQVRLKRITLIEEMSKDFMSMPPVEQLVGGFVQDAKESSGFLSLLRTTVLDEISHVTIKYMKGIVEAPSFALFRGEGDRLRVWARSDPDLDLTAHEMTVAEWVYTHGEPAGKGTQTLSNVNLFFMPMKVREETVGVIGVKYDFRSLLLDQRRLLNAVLNLSSLAVARWVNVR